MADLLYTLSLALVAVLCLLGLWSPHYRENLLQTFGMALIGSGCLLRLGSLVMGYPTEVTRFIVVYGLALYGLGTARKVWQYRGDK